MKPYYQDSFATVHHGDSTELLPLMEPESFEMVITDPPYSSGGLHAGERRLSVEAKYSGDGQGCGRPTFSGDARDQRSFGFWSTMWMSQCRRLLKTGGYMLVFTDWRQLPIVTDALQAADFIWRGVIAWDKGAGSRAPHKGYFRHQCEYVVWGTKGPCRKAIHAGPFPGCIHTPVLKADKFHQTGKPTALMRELVRVAKPNGRILDPFAGSLTTLVAAKLEARQAVGIEREFPIVTNAIMRLKTM